MTKTTLTDYRNALTAADARLETARAAVEAARVPDGDIDTGYHNEPVTVTGWYSQRTISGRPAWRHCAWVSGRLRESAPTYDRDAHEELAAAGVAHYDAKQTYEYHHPANAPTYGGRTK